MASIVKRGKTYSVVYYEGEGSNRHQVWESGLSYSAAKSRKATIEYEKEQNTHVDHNDITVSEFLYEFIEKYGEKKWVASTYDGNVGLLENYVHPYWGDKKLRSIRTKTVDDFYHFLLNEAEPATNMGKPKREHISPSTIHDIHKVLRCAFNQAKKWEYIAKNPFLDATLPEHKEAKRDALTPEQLQRVLDFTDRTDIYDLYVMHCAIQLAFACCMRGGEVGGTQWERFSRSDQVLYIDRVIDRVDKKLIEKLPKMDILFRFPNLYPGTRTVIVLKQPKTEGSIRTVYIPETVAKKLEKLREMQMKLKLELGDDGYMDYGLIICQANGRPIMTEHLNKRFKEVLIGLNDPTINVDKLVRKYHTRDPYELCQLLGIKIHYYDLQKKLKGFFYYQSRQKNIVIDHNVNGILERILVAHELGHAVLHTKIAMMHGFQEMEVFDDRSIEENEANFFAAELLLEDGKVLECLSEHTFFETAKMLYVPAALLDYKFSLLHEKGELVNSMYIRKADFLKEDLHAYDNDIGYGDI